ncbi:MAG TPA: Ig-like domain-containing protein [Candidatus Acidoferrum sp.]|nr:Ig-like domain-containing protein [Candidatus Acidoferrum sp.]
MISLSALPGGGNGPYAVTFFTNGQAVGLLAASPFTTNLGVVPVGSYTAYAFATDSSLPVAQQVYSTTNAFTITPNPLVAVLRIPTNGQTAVAGQPFSLTATSSVAAPLTVASMEFFFDGVSAGVDSSAPFSAAIANPPNGAHTVFAVATDSLGRTAFTATNSVTFMINPLANDNIADAFTLPTPASVTGNNTDATLEGNEPAFQFANNVLITWGATLWWKWTAPLSGSVTIDTFGSSINTVVSIYNGTPANGTLVVRNDNAPGFADVSLATFNAQAGTEYGIQVGGFGGGFAGGSPAQGPIQLNLSMPPAVTITSPASNSAFAISSNFTITATATSAVATVTHVDFYRGATLLGTVSNAPYSIVVSNGIPGTNTFVAVATDTLGQVGTSAGVNIALLKQGITLVVPAEDTMFLSNNPITINAVALLDVGAITNVEFFLNGESFAEDATAPFSVLLSNAPGGSHRLTAIGRSDTGASYHSQPVNFGVAATLMAYASVWKYLDDGSNQSNAWIAASFDDSSWSNGVAPLGYSDSNGRSPATVNNSGPDPDAKYPTTYYRQAIVLTNLSAYSGIRLNIERDDGAVVYLNGVELARFNMPTGAITSSTYAASTANDDGATVFSTNLSPGIFVEGINQFAVEIHQESGSSSDIWFQMQLVGLPFIIHNEQPAVAITSPTNGAIFIGTANITVDATASDTDGTITEVEFLLDGLPLAVASASPYSVQWINPVVGRHVLTAIARDNQGGLTESAPISVLVYDALGSPIAEVTNPTNTMIVEGPTNMLMTAFATALDAVTNVQFIVNHTLIGQDATRPYSVMWNAPFGISEVVAVAFGANGLIGTSAVVTVTITIPPTNTVAPIVATPLPPRFAQVTNANFTNLTIVFSERVQNLDASDLLVNGIPASGLSGSGSNYTFIFPRPQYGEVSIAFAAGHGITDFGYPTVLPFNASDPTNSWTYDYDDVIPPLVVSRIPTNSAFVTNLTTIAVSFSENVTGVNASDLLVNGTPAFAVSGSGANYVFNVSQPASGTVSISWTASHGITDLGLTGPPLAFNRTGAGATWNFTLDSRTTLVPTNSTWKYIKGFAEASNPTNAWRQLLFNDATWTTSLAPFVFGEPTFTNAAAPGTDLGDMANNAYTSIYLRKEFVVPNASAITNLLLSHRSDDGFIAWLNGVEVLRYNVAAGETPFNGGALTTASEANGNSGVTYMSVTLTNAATNLVSGTNVLAVHAFNVVTTPASSDFVFNAQLYTFMANAAVTPPRIVTAAPAQGDVFYLTNLVLTFSETVTNVEATDLLVNGVAATNLVASGTNRIFNFTFAQPAYGPVAITWAGDHGIIDFDEPPKPFTPVTLNYTLVNPSAPRVIAQVPAGGSTITGLASVIVRFSEPVTGVDASDLLINGGPASSVSGSGSNYTFTVAQPAYGLVTIRWAANHGITDLEVPSNDFNRDRPENQWSYSLVDPLPRVTMTSPTNGAVILAPADVPLRVDAADNDGTIVRVEYFEGASKIGEATASPYTATWSSVPAGNYALRAIATDNSGFTATSAPVIIEVVTELPALLVRGPYLQMGSPTGGVVRWRTDLVTDSVVRFGANPNALTNSATVAELTTEHIVEIGGLQADTKYYYSFGSAVRTLGGGTNFGTGSNYWFVSAPLTGTRKPVRLWVLGDSGTANANQRAVRDAYHNYVTTNGPSADIWLMLGDNAYDRGTDEEHQRAVFEMYPETLRNLFLWPTLGNHETSQSTTATSFPYLDIFTLPTQGEAGGVPSGTEKYYSFDYANIHFVCLDSMTSGRTATTPMANWLRDDLASTMQEWVIVFFHHPPYTKGSHNSDSENDLMQIRQNILPILEANGVDLVLGGHSHCYERSYLLNGHYGLSTTLSPSMKIDNGEGREDTTGAYQKNEQSEGVVYTVAGSSGQATGGSLNHPAHFVSLNELGSMIIDVSSNRLEGRFLTAAGATHDHFTLIKRDPLAPDGLIARDGGDNQIALTWDDVNDELGYIIERSLDGTNFVRYATNGINGTNFLDGGLLANTTYFYRIRTRNITGESPGSDSVNDFTGNKAPVLGSIADSTNDVLSLIHFDAAANDKDVPVNLMNYSLNPGAPAGAGVTADGKFHWTPSRSFAATTNLIRMHVADDGSPSLSDTQTFMIVIRDYVELGLSSSVLSVGDRTNSIVTLVCSTRLTNLNLAVLLPTARFVDLAVENLASSIATVSSASAPEGMSLTFAALPGQFLSGTQQLARLSFTAAAGQTSTFAWLDFGSVTPDRAEPGLAPSVLRNSGRVVVVANQPLVEASIASGVRSLAVFGRPGVQYLIEMSADPSDPGSWSPWNTVTLPALSGSFTIEAGASNIFYRVREANAP